MIRSLSEYSKIMILGAKGFVGCSFKMAPQFKDSMFCEERIHTREKLHHLCDLEKIQTIINCAAAGVYQEVSGSKDDIFLTNTTLVKWILEWLEENHRRKYVHFGSWFEDRVELQADYVNSKRLATKLINTQTHSVRKQIFHIRLYHVYGYHERPTRLIPSIIKSMKESSEFKILNPQKLLWLLWKEDIPSFVYSKLMTHVHDQNIIHLKGDGPYSIQDIYGLMLKIYSEPVSSLLELSSSNNANKLTKVEEGFRKLLFMP